MSAELEMFVIYERPRDYPDKYVMRRWEITHGGSRPTDYFVLADTLEEVRRAVPPWCVKLFRDAQDEPQIVESWI
jgi:hypothetical protein